MWSPAGTVAPRIGRPEAWAELLARRDRAATGSGGLTLLEGTSGVGKSTILAHLAAESPAPRYRVAAARAFWADYLPPFQLIEDALRSLSAGPSETSAPFASANETAPLAFQPAVERTRVRFSEMDPLASMDEDAPSELASDRLRLFGSWAEPILAASRKAVVLVLLDDVNRADQGSRAFLRYLLTRIADRPIWIVAACDPPGAAAPATPDPMAHLRRAEHVDRVALRPLTEVESEEFVRWALPGSPPVGAEVHRLHARSGGVPSRIVRLLSPSASPATLEGPSSPSTASEGGTPGEPEPDELRVLHLALLAGPEIEGRTIAAAAGLPEGSTSEHLAHLASQGLLHATGPGRFAFDREETRDSLVARLPAEAVQRYHRQIAEALLKDGSGDVPSVYRLARHTYLGGMDRQAVEWNQQAAAFAARSFQPEVALLYLRLALEALGRLPSSDPRTELQLRLEVAVQQAHAGPAEAAEQLLEEIRDSERLWGAADPVDRALLGVYRARVLADQGRWDEAEQSLQEMPANLRGLDRGDIPRLAYRLQGEIHYYRGNYTEALESHDAALAVALEEGEPREIAAQQIRRATVISMIPGREPEALSEYRDAIDRLLDLGDSAEAALGSLCLGVELSALGRSDEARAALAQCVQFSETANDLRRAGWAHLNLADLEFSLGRTVEAATEVRLAKVLFERVEDALGAARAALTEGRVALARGKLDEAERAFTVAGEIYAGRHLLPDQMEVELRTAELELARHAVDPARERLVRLVRDGLARLRPDLIEEGRLLGQRLGPPVVEFD
ncbi:MAG: AAA family ATPase [Thermoplasmata archaeon]|nr:AAA family ATPase [Thermoplasmata archaeon]MCI4356540.1 AAA family ATPase [Thermoplasmata archaeon]